MFKIEENVVSIKVSESREEDGWMSPFILFTASLGCSYLRFNPS